MQLIVPRLPVRMPARFGVSRHSPIKAPTKASLKIAGPWYESALLLLGLLLWGCGRSFYLATYERDIRSYRGSAYSKKARYSRAFKLLSLDERARLFGLAIK